MRSLLFISLICILGCSTIDYVGSDQNLNTFDTNTLLFNDDPDVVYKLWDTVDYEAVIEAHNVNFFRFLSLLSEIDCRCNNTWQLILNWADPEYRQLAQWFIKNIASISPQLWAEYTYLDRHVLIHPDTINKWFLEKGVEYMSERQSNYMDSIQTLIDSIGIKFRENNRNSQ